LLILVLILILVLVLVEVVCCFCLCLFVLKFKNYIGHSLLGSNPILILTEHAHLKTVTAMDVVYALKIPLG
jgi:hypothetical protein